MPLLSSFWLAKTRTTSVALRYDVQKSRNGDRALKFEVFSPKSSSDVQKGTITRSKATCPSCGAVLTAERIVEQLVRQNGGADPRRKWLENRWRTVNCCCDTKARHFWKNLSATLEL
jgi:hypothetical protein